MIFCISFENFLGVTTLLRVTNFLGVTILEISFLSSAVIKGVCAGGAYIKDVLAYTGNPYTKGTCAGNNYGKGIYTGSTYIKASCDKITCIRDANIEDTCSRVACIGNISA